MKLTWLNKKSVGIFFLVATFMLLVYGSFNPQTCSAAEYPRKDINGKLVLYSVMYKWHVIIQKRALNEAFPNLDVEFFKLGTQKLIAKIEAEMKAGGCRADIVMPLDVSWTYKMKKGGHLLKYISPYWKKIPPAQRDKDGYWAAVRFCTPIFMYNKNLIKESELPKTWLDLTDPKYKGKICMGNPSLSGTFFGVAAQMSFYYGWDYFKKLRANDVTVPPSNGPVYTAVTAGEYPLGIILEENPVYGMRTKGVKHIGIIYPKDGTVIERGDMMIFKTAKNVENAKAVYDWYLSEEGNTKTMVECLERSPIYPMPGLPSFKELSWTPFQETPTFVEFTSKNHKFIKDQFYRIMIK